MEHIDMKYSLDSKLKTEPMVSFRNDSRKKDIVKLIKINWAYSDSASLSQRRTLTTFLHAPSLQQIRHFITVPRRHRTRDKRTSRASSPSTRSNHAQY